MVPAGVSPSPCITSARNESIHHCAKGAQAGGVGGVRVDTHLRERREVLVEIGCLRYDERRAAERLCDGELERGVRMRCVRSATSYDAVAMSFQMLRMMSGSKRS